jgi:hypothetical protein
MGIIIQAQIESISTRKDKTVKLIIGTQELPQSKAGELFSMQNNLINCYLSVNAISGEMMEEIDKVSVDMIETIKSPSKRMKAVYFLLWKQSNEGYEDFELYYRWKIEAVIDFLKNKLDK